jgi:hypothetical protein
MIDRIGLLQSILTAPKPTLPAQESARPTTSRAPFTQPSAPGDHPLLEIAQRSFRLALLEALDKIPVPSKPVPDQRPAAPTAVVPPAAAQPAPPPLPPVGTEFPSPRSIDERAVIQRTAEHAAIDPAFLRALRRAENGGPGREFGVLSVPAPTYEDQARVAAESIRRNIERFEQSGGTATDSSGRYTKEFIEFFSSRYAPVGAANDLTRLNRHHAGNLVRLYAQAAPKE